MRLLIEGGRVLDAAKKIDAVKDVLIEGGKVREVGSGLKRRLPAEGLETIDARGLWVLPGIIDCHVHLREPGGETSETIKTGTESAAAGGVTTVLAMPNTEPPVDTPERVRWALARAKETAAVNVLVAGTVTKGRLGESLAPLGGMADAGAAAFTDDGSAVATAGLMRRALEYARTLGLPVIDHCEDPTLTQGGVIHEGACSLRLGVPGSPRTGETVVALRDLELARLTRGRLHIAHVSCAETVEAVRRAKAEGLSVTAEACPHHFTLTDAEAAPYDASFKMNPPLREKRDREALLKGLADGTIDVVATDHAPHAPAKKAGSFIAAPFGVIGLETLVPLTLALVHSGRLKPLKWAGLLTAGPAAVLGLRTKGRLAPGMDGDVTLVDPKAAFTVPPIFRSKSRNSPFIGRTYKGRAAATVVGGRVAWRLTAEEAKA